MGGRQKFLSGGPSRGFYANFAKNRILPPDVKNVQKMRNLPKKCSKRPISGRGWLKIFLVTKWIIKYSVTINFGRGPPGHFRQKIKKKTQKTCFYCILG